MGTPKAALEWHGSTLLRRVVGLVARAVDGPVIVVRAPGQELPALPSEVEQVEDAREGRGPLQGLAAGLAAVRDRAAAAYVSSTDVPLLHPRFIRRVLAAFDDDVDVVLPHAGGFRQPLAAVYRVTLRRRRRAPDRRGPDAPGVPVRRAAACAGSTTARCSPIPRSPRSIPASTRCSTSTSRRLRGARALARDRRSPSRDSARCAGIAPGGAEPAVVEAATLGEAAAGAGLALDEHVVAALNGDQITRDPELPLVAGDAVAFLAADAGG